MNDQSPAEAHASAIEIEGKLYMRDAKGSLVPMNMVGPVDMLMDELVRKMLGFAKELSAQIDRFKGHCFDDIGSFQALIAQQYGAGVGGRKGNITLTSFDGCLKVQLQIADLIEFGPELQAAKKIVDDCLAEWSEGSRDEIRAIVSRAFNVDKEGQINRAELFMLTRVAIEDPRWLRAMDAIHESVRIIGSRQYFRFYQRAASDAPWAPITIDLASARRPS